MGMIRPAGPKDMTRIAEIEIFNYRLYFYPIFREDAYYFGELQVLSLAAGYAARAAQFFVYDDGVVKGFVCVDGDEIVKLFVEPVLHSRGIGAALLAFAVETCHADHLWALEKNTRAIAFYGRHGFRVTSDRRLEEDTDEYLVRLVR